MTQVEKDIQKAAKGSVLNYIAALFQLGIYIFHTLASRLFGMAAYGSYIFSWAVVEVASKVAIFGLDKGVLRMVPAAREVGDIAKERAGLQTMAKVLVVASLLVALVVFMAAGLVAKWQGSKADSSVLRVMALVIISLPLTIVLVSATMATLSMRFNLIVRGIFEPLAMVAMVIVVWLVWRGDNGMPVALAHLCASFCASILALFAFHKVFGVSFFSLLFSKGEIDWAFVKYVIPISLAELSNQAIYRIDIILLGFFVQDAKVVATYGACAVMSNVISSVRYAFDPVMSPLASMATASSDFKRMEQTLRQLVRWVGMLALPLFVALTVYGDLFLRLFGKDYALAKDALAVLCVAHLVNSLLGLHQWAVVMSGRSTLDLCNNLVALVMTSVSCLFLIPRFGIIGAAVGNLVGNLTFRGLETAQVFYLFRAHVFTRPLISVLFAGLLCLLVQMGVRAAWGGHSDWQTFCVSTMAGLVCFVVVILATGLTPQERRLLHLGD